MDKKAVDLLPLVSVIIPVYNSEACLDDCIQSAINQTYKNIEIIIVNDGSTDGSASIINNYIKADARITCISKKNEGLPMARRSGIDIAQGKYIQHLDSDDSLMLDAIEQLVDKAESSNADVVVSRFNFCYPNCPEENCPSSFYDFGELSGLECFRELLVGRVYWCVWASFQRRTLFQDNPIETVSHISYGEDAILMTQLLMYAHKVVSINRVTLNYNRLSTSMSHLENINDQKYLEFRAFPAWMEEYIKDRGLYKEFEKEFALLYIRNFFLGISFRRFNFVGEDIKCIMNILKQFSDLKRVLHRRQRKVLAAYQVATWLGNFCLMNYVKKGKL